MDSGRLANMIGIRLRRLARDMRDSQDAETLMCEAQALCDVVREFAPSTDTPTSVIELLKRARESLHRWRGRYAGSDHARAAVKETNLIIEAIDTHLLNT